MEDIAELITFAHGSRGSGALQEAVSPKLRQGRKAATGATDPDQGLCILTGKVEHDMFVIREAVPTDAKALCELIAELGFNVSADLVERNLDALTKDDFVPLIADGGQVIGCATFNIMKVLHRPAPVGRISMLIVAAGWRGQGVGRALVNAAVERLRRGGCQLCEVTSNLALLDAHAFYERLGFERTSIRLARKI